ncbi:MAG: Gfo/Idh/MocA family oxidoreductase [Halioglobus sp.]
MIRKLQWGIIGPGAIAHQFAEALAQCDGGQLVAVASRTKSRAASFAEQYGAAGVHDSYQSLVDDSRVDIVYIATPHSHHYQHCRLCLEAGKHVLLEKPLTINAAQCETLIALAESRNLLLQEALWSRFMPCFTAVKQWIADGRIGDLQYITSDIGFVFGHDPRHRLNDPELGGGALLDLGVYSITISQFLMGEHPVNVQAIGTLGKSGVDETTLVNMAYPSGRYSQFTCTVIAQASNSMTIVGSEGHIVLPRHFWNGNKAILKQNDTVLDTLVFEHRVNGFEHQIEESMACVNAGKLCSDMMPHTDSLAVMQTMDEIRRQIGLKFSDELEGC